MSSGGAVLTIIARVKFDNETMELLHQVALDLHGINRSLRSIAGQMVPHPATTVRITVESEPLGHFAPPSTKENEMSQFHIGVEGCKATLVFNGPIDGEPSVSVTGQGTMTADLKVEVPTAADPTLVETKVVLHFRNATGGAPGNFGVLGTAVADNPATADQEIVTIDFPVVGEWIMPAQAKATSVSLATEVEPV